jgi:hypothetical protein
MTAFGTPRMGGTVGCPRVVANSQPLLLLIAAEQLALFLMPTG